MTSDAGVLTQENMLEGQCGIRARVHACVQWCIVDIDVDIDAHVVVCILYIYVDAHMWCA